LVLHAYKTSSTSMVSGFVQRKSVNPPSWFPGFLKITNMWSHVTAWKPYL
jgi:hypothetical protein